MTKWQDVRVEGNEVIVDDVPVVKKPWYMSKTIWTAVVTAIVSAYNGVAQ